MLLEDSAFKGGYIGEHNGINLPAIWSRGQNQWIGFSLFGSNCGWGIDNLSTMANVYITFGKYKTTDYSRWDPWLKKQCENRLVNPLKIIYKN